MLRSEGDGENMGGSQPTTMAARIKAAPPYRYVLSGQADASVPGELVLTIGPKGWTVDALSPSPLHMPPVSRIKWLLGLLELRSVRGDLEALKARLAHFRWEVEMRKGKAPARAVLDHRIRVQVVDDLGHGATSAGLGAAVAAVLPPGQSDGPPLPGVLSPPVEVEATEID